MSPPRAVALMAIFISPCLAHAQDANTWTGKNVLYTKPAEDIKFGDRINDKQVYFSFSGEIPCRVRDDREGWLRIFDGIREGWVDKADFVLENEAVAFFHRRLQADPEDEFALYMRGSAWLHKGEPENAIADFNECIRLDPNDAWAHIRRGISHWSLGKNAQAAVDFQESHRLIPKDGYAVILNALAMRRAANKTSALTFLKEATVKLDKNWPLPVIRFLRGDMDEAALTALATDTDKKTEARCYLGLDELIRGNHQKAREHFRWVVDNGTPTFIEVDIAQAELARLDK